jgi:tetratricopeptide (TPR) repeat protein
MRAVSAGDSAQAVGFLPMAISAYEIARPLNPDGLFHLALLQETAGNFEGVLASALEALADNPDHLLGLAAAARAAHALGDDGAARERYERLLRVWDQEQAKALEEYVAHQDIMPELRAEAEAFLAR